MEKINLLHAFKKAEEQIIEIIGIKTFDIQNLNNYILYEEYDEIYQENGEIFVSYTNDFKRDIKLISLSVERIHYIYDYVVNNELPVY